MDPCGFDARALLWVKELGFPIVLAAYLLFRFDGLIRKNTDALHGLRRALTDYGVGTRGGAPGVAPTRP